MSQYNAFLVSTSGAITPSLVRKLNKIIIPGESKGSIGTHRLTGENIIVVSFCSDHLVVPNPPHFIEITEKIRKFIDHNPNDYNTIASRIASHIDPINDHIIMGDCLFFLGNATVTLDKFTPIKIEN